MHLPSTDVSTKALSCKELADRLADLEQQVEYLEEDLEDPELTPAQRGSIRRQIRETREKIAAVKDQLEECRKALVIVGVERTQGIQYFLINGQGSGYAPDNSLPLIAQRALALRVYVDSRQTLSPTGSQIPPTAPQIPVYISGRVSVDRIRANGTVSHVADLTPINGSIVARPGASIDRGDPSHTLNFRLPAADCQGSLRFTVTVFEQGPVVTESEALASARPASAVGGTPGAFGTEAVAEAVGEGRRSASTQVFERFEPVPTFRIQPVLVHYTADGLDIPAPTPLEFVADLDFLLKTYPIGRLEFGDCLEIDFNESLSYGPGGCGPGWEGKEEGHEGLLTLLTNMSNASDIPAIYVALIPDGVPNPCSTGRGNTWVAAVLAGRPATLAQEVGHALRRKHSPACGAGGPYPLCGPDVPTPCYPDYGDGKYPSGSIGEFGFDVFTSRVFDPATYTDFMGYCGSRWVSPFTFMGLRAGMVDRFGEPSAAGRADGASETLFLNFRVHRDGTVEVGPGFHLPKAIAPFEHAAPSEFSCELLDQDGRVLVFHRCAPSDPHQDPDGPYLDFDEAIPWVTEASSIRFLRNREVLHIHEIEETPPEVELRAPDFQYREEPTSMEWSGRHSEEELTYLLRYSNDGGQTWRPLMISRSRSAHRVHPRLLPGGDRCLFQVVASSGIRTSVTETELFEAPMKPRIASILSPEPGTEVTEGSQVVLRGGAYSPDFGLGEMEDAVWSSNLDGFLGRGFELVAEQLSAGFHTITVTVPDGVEGTTTAQVSIRVTSNQ
jgi:hypothetical protein